MARYSALILGGLYAALAILRLIPPLHIQWPAAAPDLVVENAYGYLLGVLPSNIVLTMIHLVTGIWGVAARRSTSAALTFLRICAVGYAALMVLGLIPQTQTLFGVVPLFGANLWLHMMTAAIAGLVVWASPGWFRRRHEEHPEMLATEPRVTRPPIHALLASVPSGFIVGVFAADLAYWWTAQPWYDGTSLFWVTAALWLLAAGLCTGTLAAIPGFLDVMKHPEIKRSLAAQIHMIGSVTVLLCTLGNLLLRSGGATVVIPWGLGLSTITLAVLAVSNWYGVVLVYRDMVGTMRYTSRGGKRRQEFHGPPVWILH